MTAILAGASVAAGDFGNETTHANATIVVPAGCTRLIVGVALRHYSLLPTVSACTWNGVTVPQISGSYGTDALYSSELRQLVSPATGSHALNVTATSGAFGGVLVAFVMGDTGVGSVGNGAEPCARLSPAAAASSIVVFFAALVNDAAQTASAGPFQNSGLVHNFSVGSPDPMIAVMSTQRGYPSLPPAAIYFGGNGAASAVEITGAADVIF